MILDIQRKPNYINEKMYSHHNINYIVYSINLSLTYQTAVQ